MKRLKKILIVDDEPGLLEYIAIPLYKQQSGYQFWQAKTLAEARDLIEDRDFDLVLLDVIMNGERGTDLLPYLREKGIRTALCTAMPFQADKMEGVVGIISKPWTKNTKIDRFFADASDSKPRSTMLDREVGKALMKLDWKNQRQIWVDFLARLPLERVEDLRDLASDAVLFSRFEKEPQTCGISLQTSQSAREVKYYWNFYRQEADGTKCSTLALQESFNPKKLYGLTVEQQLNKILSWAKEDFADDPDFIEASRQKLVQLGWDKPVTNSPKLEAEPLVSAPKIRKIKLY